MSVVETIKLFWPAILAAAIVGAAAPTIGAFVVQKRLALIGDGVGHMAFAGVALGLWFGIAPLAGALGAAILGALALDRVRRRSPEESDLALALFFYGSIAVAVVVASRTGSFNGPRLFGFLFGQILTVTHTELVTIGILGVVVTLVVISFYRGLVATAIDEEAAAVAGVPVVWLNAMLMTLAATAIGVGMQVVGILLVAAIMVLPVGVARNLVLGFRNVVIASAVIGATSSFAGLLAANAFDTAASGTIVLVLIGAYAVSTMVATVRGSRARRARVA